MNLHRLILINRNFTVFMAGSLVNGFGGSVFMVSMSWLVLDLSNSTFLLGLANFLLMIPILALSFPVGALSDRLDRRKIIQGAQIVTASAAILLAVAATLGLASIPLILCIAFFAGIGSAFSMPVWPVFVKDLVGLQRLQAAASFDAGRDNLARIAGPAFGGWLLAQFGVPASMRIGAVMLVTLTAILPFLRVERGERSPSRHWLASLREGLTYSWHQFRVRELLSLTAAMAFLILPYGVLLPAFARDVLLAGPQGLGLLMTCAALGALGGALLAGRRFMSRSPDLTMALLALSAGLALAVFSQSRWFALSAAMMALVGLSCTGFLVTARVTLQLMVRADIVGRVMGLFTVVFAGLQPVGSLTLGAAAQGFGLTTTVTISSFTCVLFALVMAGRSLQRVVSVPVADS